MTLVGVISDTHGTLDVRAFNALADCDVIIHAGDIGFPDILHQLQTLAPVHAVLGNNDIPEYGKLVGRFAKPVIDGVRFLVAHYPKDVALTSFGSSAVAPGDPIPDVRIHGHTHVPELETGKQAAPSALLLCPGSASRPRGFSNRSIAKIEVEDGRVLRAWIEELTGTVVFDTDRGGSDGVFR